MVSLADQLSKKYVHTKWVYLDGWTAAHLLLGIVIASTPIGSTLLGWLGLYPRFSLFLSFVILTVAWEIFELFGNRLLRVKYFKEANIDIFWDIIANLIGFWIGVQL